MRFHQIMGRQTLMTARTPKLLTKIGRNDATEMIDLAIKLDHSTEYPYTRIEAS